MRAANSPLQQREHGLVRWWSLARRWWMIGLGGALAAGIANLAIVAGPGNNNKSVSFVARAEPPEATGSIEELAEHPPAAQLGRVAFVRAGDVWVKDLPDGQERQLTHDGRNSQPRWSASGEWLTFSRADPTPRDTSAATRQELWVVRADGRGARRVDYATQTGAVVVDADGANRRELPGTGADAWSPDGQWRAYARTESLGIRDQSGAPERHASLWIVRADGSQATKLLDAGTPSPSGYIVAGWSPDAQHVLYWVNAQFSASGLADGAPLMAVPTTGGPPVEVAPKMLTHRDFLAWQPGGGQLALVDGGYRAVWERKAIGVTDLAGPARRLSDPDRADLFPAWSSDGQWLAYTSAPAVRTDGGDEARQASARRRIWRMRPDGSSKQALTRGTDVQDEHPQWSRDGQHLLFARVVQGAQPQLWLMRADGAEPRLVADALDAQVLTGYPLAVDPPWFGYYGYLDWGRLYDWWQPTPSYRPGPLATTSSRPAPSPVPPSAPALASRTAASLVPPSVEQFALASYRRVDAHADPKGGTPVYIVDPAIVVRATVRHAQRLDVHLTRSARETVTSASGVPDASGAVELQLHLPEAGTIYVVQGYAVAADQRPLQLGELGNERGERVRPAGAFRVMTEPTPR